jgi:hypothetical protein
MEPFSTSGNAEGVGVAGTYAYVADLMGGLVILRFVRLEERVYLTVVVRND